MNRREGALRVVVIGCGGIGGVVSARLLTAGHDVSAVTSNPMITEAVKKQGLIAFYDDAFHTSQPTRIWTSLEEAPADTRFDLCLLAVPPTAAEEALTSTLPFLTEDAQIVSFPNGLIEERLLGQLPNDRLIGGIVSFGASMLAPGRVEQTSRGGFTLGRLEPLTDDPELDRVDELLSAVGPIQRTDNLRGARWSKLAINCTISSMGTIGGDRLGVLMRYRQVRRMALEIMTEVVQVAQAEGVQLEKVAGTLDLDWLAMDEEERLRSGSAGLLAKHTVLLAVGAKYRRMRSSMLAAIERGREPAVDFLNGEITSRAERWDIPVPINQAILNRVHDVAEGEEWTPTHEALLDVYDTTRPVLRQLELSA